MNTIIECWGSEKENQCE